MIITEEQKSLKVRTLKQLAAALGVSRTTVSNAFNRPDQLSDALRNQILEAAREFGYAGPNPVARKLRTGRAGAVGVLFGGSLPYAFTDPAAIAFLRGVAQICEQNHSGVLILPVVNEPDAGRMIREAVVDGFVTYCLPDESPVIPCVLERGLPVTMVEQSPIAGVNSIEIDDTGGAYTAARHLLMLGHRQFAILSLDLRPDGRSGRVSAARRSQIQYALTANRLTGFETAFREAGLKAAMPVIECPHNDRGLAREFTAKLLKGKSPPTAILTMSDELALGALQAAGDCGIPVPESLSIVGFDDIPLASQVRPALTTVRQPLAEKGRLAVEILFKQKSATEELEHHRLETSLVVRESTGPIR